MAAGFESESLLIKYKVNDRKRPGSQSILAKALVERARDLAEGLKVHRIPSADHVVACLLIEPLQSRRSRQ